MTPAKKRGSKKGQRYKLWPRGERGSVLYQLSRAADRPILTADEFVEKLKFHGIGIEDFARLTHVSAPTVRRWLTGDSVMPGWPSVLFEIFEGSYTSRLGEGERFVNETDEIDWG